MQKELQPRHSVWCVGTNAQTCIALIAAAVVRLRMAQNRCQTRLQQAIAAAHQRRLDDAAINLRHNIHRRGLSGVAGASSEIFLLAVTRHHPERGNGNYCFCAPSLQGDWGGEVCSQEIARSAARYLYCGRESQGWQPLAFLPRSATMVRCESESACSNRGD